MWRWMLLIWFGINLIYLGGRILEYMEDDDEDIGSDT